MTNIYLKEGKFGGEFDKCKNCGDNGDNCNLYETTNGHYICEHCMNSYKEALECTDHFNSIYRKEEE